MQNILAEFEQPLLRTKEASNLRIGAFFLDWLLLAIISFIYIRIFGEETTPNQWKVEGLAALPLFLLWFGYFILLEGLIGATLGKKLVGIQVVTLDGDKITIGQAFVRRLGDFIDIYWCLGLLGFILLKTTKNNQRIADKWARTIVVKAMEH